MRTNLLADKWQRLILCVLLIGATLSMSAQQKLQIEQVFDRFARAKNCKMVLLRHTSLRGFQLDVYKSLTYKDLAPVIEPYLKADRKQAKKIKEVIEDGRVISGYYMMTPLKEGVNRYILFRKGNKNSGTVIYIEGALSPDEIMKMCYSKR